MSPSRRAVLRAATTATILGVGASCARIPVDSPVSTHELGGGSPPGAPYVRALPPEDGASALDVVEGFIQAGVGPDDDFEVAREHLTPALRDAWDPTASVSIYSAAVELQLSEEGEAEVTAVLQIVATLDAQGVRQVLAGPMPREVRFEVEQVDDEWRIAAAPDGIFLSEAAFETLYMPARLYFLDSRRLRTVADHRWFPIHRGTAAVLEGFAHGPSELLAGAVLSEVPTTASVARTPTAAGPDGQLQVTLPPDVGTLPGEQRSRALAQIDASLRSLRTVPGVRFTWQGTDLAAADEASVERALPGHRPIGAGTTGIVSLADPSAEEPTQLVPDLEEDELSAPVLSHDGQFAAALTTGDTALVIASTDGSVAHRELTTGGRFAAPRIDDAGYVWTSTRESSGLFMALSAGDPELDVTVDAPWLDGREVRAFDIAPDATRMIVLSADDDETRLDLCAVHRDEQGVPSSLSDPAEIRAALADMTAASWYDEIAVLVLGEDPGSGETRAEVVDFVTGRNPLPVIGGEMVRVAGSSVSDTYWAMSEDGRLWRTEREAWSAVEVPARDPGFY